MSLVLSVVNVDDPGWMEEVSQDSSTFWDLMKRPPRNQADPKVDGEENMAMYHIHSTQGIGDSATNEGPQIVLVDDDSKRVSFFSSSYHLSFIKGRKCDNDHDMESYLCGCHHIVWTSKWDEIKPIRPSDEDVSPPLHWWWNWRWRREQKTYSHHTTRSIAFFVTDDLRRYGWRFEPRNKRQ